MYKQLKDSSIRHKELLIFVSYLVCTIMGLKLAIIGSADSKDKVTYHSDNYEVWYNPGNFATTSWSSTIYRVKGPFRKFLYDAYESDGEELKSDKAIDAFLKQKCPTSNETK